MTDGRRSRVWISDLDGGRHLVLETDRHVEAPNWAVDDTLVVNADGRLWHLPVSGSGTLAVIPAQGLPPVNNDHVIAPDGPTLYASAEDGHLWTLPRFGGPARRITGSSPAAPNRRHYLHGVSPDGSTLVYVAVDDGAPAHLRLVCIEGDGDRGLTEDRAATGTRGPDDGPEFSPDGAWVYFSTETWASIPGHAQLARIRPDGSELTRLTHDDGVHWFPHLAPTGTHAVYLVYPSGTTGHPADRPVQLRVVAVPEWDDAIAVIELTGGQGTINVPSWSPDGTRFAWFDYAPAGR